MAGSYTADEQAAAVFAGGIADGPTSIKAGNTTVQSTTTASTTASVTHGLSGTPDFCIAQSNKADVAAVAWSANSTTLTFTVTSATGFIISYIAGYTA
jgi:hypothetical protein